MAESGTSPVTQNISYGIGMESSPSKGRLSLAVNAVVEGFDGDSITYQNEPGNQKCIDFGEFSVVKSKTIIEKDLIIYFLTSPTTSKISTSTLSGCTLTDIITAPCLNFSLEFPIKKVEYEINGDALRIYWCDNYNPDRFLDFSNLPYKRVQTSPGTCDYTTTTEIDCNLLRVHPHFNIPYITVNEVSTGGNLVSGTYQFGIQYSDSVGSRYTEIYNITDPVPVFKDAVTQDFNIPTDKAISLTIHNLDTTRFSYFNLIVVKTINAISTPELVGTYECGPNKSIVYTGQATDIKLTTDDLFERFPIVEKSEGVTTADKVLIWHGITNSKRVNYQSIASNIQLKWISYIVPPTENIDQYRGYMGDEVYAFEFQPILASGKKCDGFHIPGRLPTDYDLELVDNPLNTPSLCNSEDTTVPRWRVQNTAQVITDYITDTTDPQTQLQQDLLSQQIEQLKTRLSQNNTEYEDNSKQASVYIDNIIDLSKADKDSIGQLALSILGLGGIIAGILDRGWHSVAYDLGGDKTNDLYNLITTKPIDLDAVQALLSPLYGKHGTGEVAKKMYSIAGQINDLYTDNTSIMQGIEDDTQQLNIVYGQYNSLVQNTTICSAVPYQYGEFGYYESTELYPCNENIWGTLSGKPIRHHKFPKRAIHDNMGNLYPLGIQVDIEQIKVLIRESNLTQQEKDDIVGFKILRADRTNNKSIIAKGLINNVGIYNRDNETYFYPNYPYNDVRPDPFISILQTKDDSGPSAQLNGFYSEESKKRFTFHSPDTSFYQPNLGDYIELNSIEYGTSKGHYVPVKNHPKYQIPSRAAYATCVAITMGLIAAGSKEGIGFAGVDMFGGSQTDWEQSLAVLAQSIELITKSIPHKELAYQYNSVGDYSLSSPIPDGYPTIFPLSSNSRYLSDGLANIEDIYQLNNYLRETAVFLKTESAIPYTHEIDPTFRDESRILSACDNSIQSAPIASYNVSIKRVSLSQYGQIYSYETIDTGHYIDLASTSTADVFGGDIFLSRFAYKSKLSYFTSNLVGRNDNEALDFRNYGNIGYPTYWLSNDRDGKFTWADLLQEASSVLVGAAAGGLGSMSIGGALRGGVAGGILGALAVLMDNWQNNFACAGKKFFYQDGKFFLFSYGIPYFYVESEVNCKFRQAFNGKEGDFYPHMGTQIPDEWLQEVNTPIVNDNTYFYNKTFSKQNKEGYFSHLPEDYTPQNTHPNRAYYSKVQSSEVNYKVNNWLIYRPLSFHDFPQTNGKLISLDRVANREILARFENKTELYNALLRIDTSNPQAAYIGNSTLFDSAPPIDFSDTDSGYIGTQHKFLLRTPYGNITTDSERGSIFILSGQKAKDISQGISKFLAQYLPFQISSIPGIDIDNNYNGIGLHGVYDSSHNRVIITKLDYIPKVSDITYKSGKFVYNNKQISLTDTNYFQDNSFTLSYHFPTQSWTSFHTYFPLFYIETPLLFYSGNTATYLHDPNYTKFNFFYDKIEPFIIEYPYSYQGTSQILQSVQEYNTVIKYFSSKPGDYSEVDNIWYDEALLYSNKQCSGTLKLSYQPKNNMAAKKGFPVYSPDSKTILYTKSDNLYKYNTFWSLIKDYTQPILTQGPNMSLSTLVNNTNMDYSKRSFKKEPLRTDNLKVRHTLNSTSDYKFLSHFSTTKTERSIR